MEVALIIALFASNAIALDCLYNRRIKTTGALLILNLCLTVAIAYQFKQMTQIMYILLTVVGVILVILAIRFYLKKKKNNNIIEVDKYIENGE